jgi:hypothetical protein
MFSTLKNKPVINQNIIQKNGHCNGKNLFPHLGWNLENTSSNILPLPLSYPTAFLSDLKTIYI